jgi:hypothetical protein
MSALPMARLMSNGKTVSLAFDGRADVEHEDSSFICEKYAEYVDCPVRLDNKSLTDRNTVRALRDALNALNLEG